MEFLVGGSSTEVSCEFLYMLLCCTALLSDVCFWKSCIVKWFFFSKKKKLRRVFLGGGFFFFFSIGEHSCFGLKSCICCCSKAMEEAGIKLCLAYTGLFVCFNNLCLFLCRSPNAV